MAGELVETGRLWARQNAAIKPEWAERLGGDLVKRAYSEPHWSKQAGRGDGPRAGDAVRRAAGRRPARAATAGSTPALARELFIRHALVYGEWHTRAQFFAENRRLLDEAEELEHRARRRDLVVDEHTLFDFYDAADRRRGRQRRPLRPVVEGRAARRRPDLLTFDPAMLTHDAAEEVREGDFPTSGRRRD